jgi:hypothetical protein
MVAHVRVRVEHSVSLSLRKAFRTRVLFVGERVESFCIVRQVSQESRLSSLHVWHQCGDRGQCRHRCWAMSHARTQVVSLDLATVRQTRTGSTTWFTPSMTLFRPSRCTHRATQRRQGSQYGIGLVFPSPLLSPWRPSSHKPLSLPPLASPKHSLLSGQQHETTTGER